MKLISMGGGGGSAIASYVTLGLDSGLTSERKLTNSASVTLTDGGANGNVTLTVVPGGVDHGGLAGLADNDHPQYGLVSGTLAQFAATTSAQLAGVLSDETGGTGVAVFNASPTLTGVVTYSSGAAVTAGSYQSGRDNNATNQRVENVPTGAGFLWSIQGTQSMTLNTSGQLMVGPSTTHALTTDGIAQFEHNYNGPVRCIGAYNTTAGTNAYSEVMAVSGPLSGTFVNAFLQALSTSWTTTGQAVQGEAQFGVSGSGTIGLAWRNLTNTYQRWLNNDTETMRMLAAGNLMLGSTTATGGEWFGVYKNIAAGQYHVFCSNTNSAGNCQVAVNSDTCSMQMNAIGTTKATSGIEVQGNAVLRAFGTATGMCIGTADGKPTSLWSNNLKRFEVDNAYTVSFFSSATKKHTFAPVDPAASVTITIPDLGTAVNMGLEIEGTFTPTVTLVGGAGNVVPVYSTNTGRYTRIGNRVFVDIYLTGDGGAEGAGTGTFNVALPITAGASNPTSFVPCGYALNNTAEYELYGQIAGSATTIALQYFNLINTSAAFTGADQNNATRTVRLHFFYEV